jgi:hypothetical protein
MTHGVGIDTSLIHKSRRIESREERTHELQTDKLITVVGRKENMDRRSGIEEFVDLEIEKKGSKFLAKFSKYGDTK